MNEAFLRLLNYRKVVDEVVISDADKSMLKLHIQRAKQFLQRCSYKGISRKRENSIFAKIG